MPKNIVLCSDGTGNSGAKLNGTNVWRLFEALDRSTPPEGYRPQIAFYDDGVGTDSFKPLRAIGGAFGWGLTRNLEQLYGHLIRHYDPGDDLYLFGFSRGAFTVRALSNILYYCGLPNRDNQSLEQIDQLAHDAVEAYKRRTHGDRNQGAPQTFRDKCRPGGGHADVSIKLIGVWDTVDAVGLPFDELTHLFAWLMPLRLDESLPEGKLESVREDDLHPLVERAYHAMAIDDERHTFHPVLFQEKYPFGSDNAGVAKPIVENGRLEQVWFAGMHSNVGGGYPQDGLALVSLNWMLDRVESAASPTDRLRFVTLRNDYRRDADAHGRLYDSRAGTGVLYRFRPRPIEQLVRQADSDKAKIHWSVFDRIQRGTDDYLPIGIPQDYISVEAPATGPKEQKPAERFTALADAADQVLVGRAQYILFILFFLLLAAFATWGGRSLTDPLPPAAFCCEQLLRSVEGTLLDLMAWVTPAYFESGIVVFRERPGTFLGALFFLFFLWAWSAEVDRRLRKIASDAWRLSLPHDPPVRGEAVRQVRHVTQRLPYRMVRAYLHESRFGNGVGKAIRRSSTGSGWLLWLPVRAVHWVAEAIARWLRSDRIQNKWVWWSWKVMPWVVAIVMVIVIAILGWRTLWSYRLTCHAVQKPLKASADLSQPVIVDFATNESFFDTGVDVVEGERYHITVTEITDKCKWTDNGHPASPTGVSEPSFWMRLAIPLRRSVGQPWLMLVGSLGTTGSDLIPIGCGVEFEASRSARLYLFANDAPPDCFYDYYGNNAGCAKVSIQPVSQRSTRLPTDCLPKK